MENEERAKIAKGGYASSEADFVNALRECLGLDPLYVVTNHKAQKWQERRSLIMGKAQ